MKLIDKDALVAEINELKKEVGDDEYWHGYDIALDGVLYFLDTLEVKDVDFEKIWKEYFKYRGDVATVNVKHLAKHFFELGVNASNPLTWEDIKLIWNITDEMDNIPEEEFYKEVLKRFKAQKGE